MTRVFLTRAQVSALYPPLARINRDRFDPAGGVLSTFYPKCYTSFNCRAGALFLRKWRGPRWRGRAKQQRKREARITPEEIDYLAQATLSRMAKNTVIAIDRVRCPSLDFL